MTDIVFSDVAGTIIEGDPWDYIRQHRVYKNESHGQREVIKFLPTYIGNKINLVSDSTFRYHWLRSMAAAFKGLHRDILLAMYRDILNHEMKHLYRRDVIERLQQHKADGGHVVLVSGMFVEMVDMFVDEIGADAGIGTRIVYDAKGYATGEIDGETCVGSRKLDFIRAYLREHHLDVSLSDCYGYADSYSDRALLRSVGHSVATYPDDNLRPIAEAAGWDIIS